MSSIYAAVSSRLITGRSGCLKKKMICSTPFASLRQCTTIFTIWLRNNRRVRDIVRERRHRVHIVLGAVRKQERQLRSYLRPHPVKSVEWTIDSIKIRGRAFQTLTTIQRIDFILGLMRMMAQPVTVCTCEAVNKAIVNGRVYTRQMFPDPSG
jgi:hypothetical protein